MRDPRLDKLAEVVVGYCAPVRKGDLVTIVGEPGGAAGVEALFEAILRAGGHPSFHPKSERLHELVLRHGSDEQVRHICPFEEYRLIKCDVLIVLICPSNTRYLSGVDPKRLAMGQAARRGLLTMSLQRKAAGEVRYCLTEIPSAAAAQDAEMSLEEYADFVYRAGFLHLADPVAAWRRLHEQQERAVEFLRGKKTMRFQSPACHGERGARRHDGTDVTVDVSGRAWSSCAGGDNFPDGEIYTGPRGVDGVVNYTFPAVYKGKEVDGIRLKFKAGRVVEASATKNEEYLIALLDQDEGARNAGEVAMGTNYELKRCIKNAFFDEKIGGSFHIAVGAGYPETGNTNESALHWDMVTDLRPGGTYPGSAGGVVWADGEEIQRDGRFLREGWPGSRDGR